LFPTLNTKRPLSNCRPGDTLVFYSDGVVEMRNDNGEEFGLRRLAETVRHNHERTAEEIVKSVSAALADFIGRIRPNDDRTMVVVKMGMDQ
jgi:sigma-B regulation protein RsbU (phosphoserine phosphatase)